MITADMDESIYKDAPALTRIEKCVGSAEAHPVPHNDFGAAVAESTILVAVVTNDFAPQKI